jgi:DNA-binding NarL/FixJ family response regulator
MLVPEMTTIRVLLVDDHPLVAEPLAREIEAQPDLTVAGLLESLAALADWSDGVDVVLLDYELPDGTGLTALRNIKRRWPAAKVIMLTAHTDDPIVLAALRDGAEGFLAKADARRETVLDAIRRAHAGEIIMPVGSIDNLRSLIDLERRQLIGEYVRPSLSARENEIIQALARGLTAGQIAAQMHISPSTARTHLENIRYKLRAHSMLEIVTIALRERLVEPPTSRTIIRDSVRDAKEG